MSTSLSATWSVTKAPVALHEIGVPVDPCVASSVVFWSTSAYQQLVSPPVWDL